MVSDLVGYRKPEAAIFLTAADKLGVRPAKILFVGDNPEADVWGAHRAGLRTAWLHRDQTWPSTTIERCADFTIGSLDELVDIIASMRGKG